MSRRRGPRLAPGLSACLLAVLVACGGDGAADHEPDDPAPPEEFAATFEVQGPLELVAGESAAWVLTDVEGGASLVRIDHTGRPVVVARLPGQHHDIAPYQGGVVVARVACEGDECEETAAKVLVLDGAGATVAEVDVAREPGVPDNESGTVDRATLIGVDGDVIWMDALDDQIGFDPGTGQTSSGEPDLASPEWSPPPDYRDLWEYELSGDPAVPPFPVAGGQGGQVFVLETDGVIRRYVDGNDVGTLDVPADVFPRYGTLLFDRSPTLETGCFWQSVEHRPTAQCLVRSA